MEKLKFTNGLTICWERGLDGGGSIQYKDFLNLLSSREKKYKCGLEWCSGLGAIGFSILDSNLCEKMVFMDLYLRAGYWTELNANMNEIADKVKFIHSDKIANIQQPEKFDLVVSNPPHCLFIVETDDEHVQRLTLDQNWDIHAEFFSNIGKFLENGADIFLSETSIHPTHIELAEKNKLKFIEAIPADELKKFSSASAVLMHFKYEA